MIFKRPLGVRLTNDLETDKDPRRWLRETALASPADFYVIPLLKSHTTIEQVANIEHYYQLGRFVNLPCCLNDDKTLSILMGSSCITPWRSRMGGKTDARAGKRARNPSSCNVILFKRSSTSLD